MHGKLILNYDFHSVEQFWDNVMNQIKERTDILYGPFNKGDLIKINEEQYRLTLKGRGQKVTDIIIENPIELEEEIIVNFKVSPLQTSFILEGRLN